MAETTFPKKAKYLNFIAFYHNALIQRRLADIDFMQIFFLPKNILFDIQLYKFLKNQSDRRGCVFQKDKYVQFYIASLVG